MVQDSVDIAKSLYASFRRQDTESVLDLFADVAILHGPTSSTEILPWGVLIMEEKVLNNSSSY